MIRAKWDRGERRAASVQQELKDQKVPKGQLAHRGWQDLRVSLESPALSL